MNVGPHVSRVSQESSSYGKLYLTAPSPETQTLLCRVACNGGLVFGDAYENVVALSVSGCQLQQLTRDWADALNPAELEHTKCYLAESHVIPSYAELMNSQSLSQLIDGVKGQRLKEIIETGGLMTYFQPIVRVANPDVIYGYECLLRGQDADGELISPLHLYSVARGAGLVDHLDCAARIVAIESASSYQLNTRVFVNVNPHSLDRSHPSIENTLLAAMASSVATDHFVFEFVESDEITDIERVLHVTDQLRDAGCCVALDDVGAGYNSLNLLARIKPDYIKIDMGLIRGVGDDAYKACVAAKLLELARELEVKTVVEGVETENEWRWAVQNGADFAQGYLFASPAAVPAKSEFSLQNAS